MGQVAIVGAGPAGCYTALALTKTVPDADIAVFDRLPFPYGLIRYGVAGDHQGTKAVTAQFDRMFRRGQARFLGGIEIGRDVSLDTLIEAFDAVVWAGGMSRDRRLDVPGEDLEGVYGAGEVSRAWNAHPDQGWQHIRIGPRVTVVGAGNVALDLVRLLAKTEPDLEGSDLDEVFGCTVPGGVTEVGVIVRAEPDDVRWDAAMLRELASLDGVVIEIDEGSVDGVQRAAESGHAASAVLAEAGRREHDGPARVRVRVDFAARVTRVAGEGTVSSVTIDQRGTSRSRGTDTVLTAIGFEGGARPAHPRLVPAGWARTGPRGTIPALRAAARDVVDDVVPLLGRADGRAGVAALGGLTDDAVDFTRWARIDDHELATAPAGRCRRKIRDLAHAAQLTALEVVR